MYILYADASGTPGVGENGDVFALLGICVHEGTWFALEKRVGALKARYSYPQIPFELHAKDFCRAYPEQDKIPDFESLDWDARRRAVLQIREQRLQSIKSPEERREHRQRYRASDPFIHLSRRERSQLFEDALDLVGSHDGIRLFGEVISKSHLLKMSGTRDASQRAFAQLVSRFDAFLTRSNGPGYSNNDNGLLMMDREPTIEKMLETTFAGYREHGHPWGRVNHVIEAPLFVDSSKTSAVQTVDLCAYAVRRYVERANQLGSFEEANFCASSTNSTGKGQSCMGFAIIANVAPAIAGSVQSGDTLRRPQPES